VKFILVRKKLLKRIETGAYFLEPGAAHTRSATSFCRRKWHSDRLVFSASALDKILEERE